MQNLITFTSELKHKYDKTNTSILISPQIGLLAKLHNLTLLMAHFQKEWQT